MDLVPYAVPFFILAILLELGYGLWRKRNTYRLNDSIGSLFMGSLSTTIKLVFIGAGGVVFAAIEQDYALWRMDTAAPGTWIFAWFGYDLCYYWFHRIGHERQVFWASHVAHHQSEDYNLGTALRQTSTGGLLTWVFFVPLFLVGVPAEVYVTVASANLIYQFWVHTQHVPKLGPLEWVLITPSNHRVHHAQNELYMDRNYGGVFILWDRLFGSYQEELEEERCIYGIRGPLLTFNPLWANLHIYAGMLSDAWYTRQWRDKLEVIVSRTGWRPEDVAISRPRSKTDLQHFQKYDPPVAGGIQLYALLQFFVTFAVGIVLLYSPAPAYPVALAAVAGVLFTMVCTTEWLDGHEHALIFEVLRLVLLAVAAMLLWSGPGNTRLLLVLVGYILANALLLPWLRQIADERAVTA